LLRVVCGCLALVGIVFSTFSAQICDGPAPIPVTSGVRQLKSRKRNPTRDGVPPIAASYARYSSEQQSETSNLDQERGCEERARRVGAEFGPNLRFRDEAVSGTKAERDGLNRMMQAARRGEFSILIVHSLSRLARESVLTLPMLKDLVINCGVRVISVSDGIDTAHEGWFVQATFMSLGDEQFIRNLRNNVLKGQEGSLLAGFALGDHCLGYTSEVIPGGTPLRKGRNAKPAKQYVIEPEGAATVRLIFHWFCDLKLTLSEIVRRLNEQKVRKDHRSTTPHWHHDYVVRILRNRKYIGIWRWGQKTNVRDPLTGNVHQEDRPEEEVVKWERHRPDLRIISDQMFQIAQQRLDEMAAKYKRKKTGLLSGSYPGSAHENPRYLLSGLIFCRECGTNFHVGGPYGHYLVCPRANQSACTCRTKLNRAQAERMIGEVIGRRILECPAWEQRVLERLQECHAQIKRQSPAELERNEAALAEANRIIKRLVDAIEQGCAEPDVSERLAQRRSERSKLEVELARYREAADREIPEPSIEWVRERISNLGELLQKGGPAAAFALRGLVGGRIEVWEVRRPGRKRHYLRGRLQFSLRTITSSVAPSECDGGEDRPTNDGEGAEAVEIDFREQTLPELYADRVKSLWDEGLTCPEIASRLGIDEAIVAKARNHWFSSRCMEPPLWNDRQKQPERAPTLPEQLSEAAKALWDELVPMKEIAARLNTDRDMVTKAIRIWHEKRGLTAIDGRGRRKLMPRTTRKRNQNTDRADGEERESA
jgi:hypothetical protein